MRLRSPDQSFEQKKQLSSITFWLYTYTSLCMVWSHELVIAHPLSPRDLFIDKEKRASCTSGARKYNFPGRSFGSKGESRSFKAAWFDNWSRLDHQEMSDSVHVRIVETCWRKDCTAMLENLWVINLTLRLTILQITATPLHWE